MKSRCQQGSILIATIGILSVLIILSIGVLSFMLNENKQSLYQQRKIQAHYIAKGGAEAAASYIKSISEDDIDEFNNRLPLHTKDTNFGEGNFNLNIIKNANNDIEIQSTGKVPNGKNPKGDNVYVTDVVTLVLDKIEEEITKIIDVEFSLFAFSKISIKGNPKFNSAIFTESTNYDDVTINSESSIRIEDIKMGREKNYGLANIPSIPKNIPSGIIIKGEIYNTGSFSNINIDRLEIKTNDKDIIIVTDSLIINKDLTITGSGKVKIFVREALNIRGDINKNGSIGMLDIYYYGINDLNLNGDNINIISNIYISEANTFISGNITMKGNIISNGNIVNIKSNADIKIGSIYAPSSDVTITGNVQMANGAIICDSIDIDSNIHVNYDEETFLPIEINPFSEETITAGYKHGYYK